MIRNAIAVEETTAPRSSCIRAELLATKLRIPPLRPTLVPRSDLFRRLDDGLRRGHRLTLVSAPAGAGKTTLLSAWLASLEASDLRQEASRPKPGLHNDITSAAVQAASRGALQVPQAPKVAWLALDPDDDDPISFWTYFLAALQTIDVALGQSARRLLDARQPPPLHTILSAALNDLATCASTILLVLDDYHVITTSTIHEGIAFILDHAPSQFHMVLSSRSDPLLPIVRLRARNQSIELRATDLRFSVVETAAFLTAMTGLEWRPEEVLTLWARTDGWPVGLQIAGLRLQKLLAASPSLSIHERQMCLQCMREFAGDHQAIVDYLEEEVLSQQPEHIRVFLIATSILGRLSGPLCEAVTGQSGGSAMLEQLEKANLFVVPLDGERHWYRYNHLLADALRARLRQTQPDLEVLLHRRAAEWYEQQGWPAEAIHHTLAAGDTACAAQLIEQHWQQIAQGGAVDEVLSWLDELPDSLVRNESRVEHAAVGNAASAIAQSSRISDECQALTEREQQILRLIAEGLTYPEMSERLVIGLNTVRFHIKHIYSKLNVHHRFEAIARAREFGLLA